MTVIGITGPSGSGKGECSKYLLSLGYSILDADAIYHDLLIPPSKCLDELVREFGKQILTAGGLLNRETLASLVFGEENRDRLLKLNEISHRHVTDKIKKILCSLRAMGAPVCVIDAPLLIEAGLVSMCDFTISVLADKEIRIERVTLRDKIDRERATRRIESQKSDEFYIQNTNYAVYNNSDKQALIDSISAILKERGVYNAK